MYKKMAVLLDGSELAELVFKYAVELAGRMGVELELIHVCNPHESEQLPMRRAYIEHMAEILCTKAEEVRKKYGKEELGQCVVSHGTVLVGDPAEEILNYVEEQDIDLVMMSTHGSSGVRRWNLGSVANKVIHATRVPVWLVPVELREEVLSEAIPGRTLVVPLSGDDKSKVALSHAVHIVRQRGAESELLLLHVVEPPATAVSLEALEAFEKRRSDMEQFLEETAQPLRESGLAVHTVVLVGDPAESIINYLKDHPAQLLCMATRARTGVSRFIFGSVTESVVQLVKKTPLLLVSE